LDDGSGLNLVAQGCARWISQCHCTSAAIQRNLSDSDVFVSVSGKCGPTPGEPVQNQRGVIAKINQNGQARTMQPAITVPDIFTLFFGLPIFGVMVFNPRKVADLTVNTKLWWRY